MTRKNIFESIKDNYDIFTEEQLCEIYDVAYELILDTLMLDDYDSKLSNKVSSFKTFL